MVQKLGNGGGGNAMKGVRGEERLCVCACARAAK